MSRFHLPALPSRSGSVFSLKSFRHSSAPAAPGHRLLCEHLPSGHVHLASAALLQEHAGILELARESEQQFPYALVACKPRHDQIVVEDEKDRLRLEEISIAPEARVYIRVLESKVYGNKIDRSYRIRGRVGLQEAYGCAALKNGDSFDSFYFELSKDVDDVIELAFMPYSSPKTKSSLKSVAKHLFRRDNLREKPGSIGGSTVEPLAVENGAIGRVRLPVRALQAMGNGSTRMMISGTFCMANQETDRVVGEITLQIITSPKAFQRNTVAPLKTTADAGHAGYLTVETRDSTTGGKGWFRVWAVLDCKHSTLLAHDYQCHERPVDWAVQLSAVTRLTKLQHSELAINNVLRLDFEDGGASHAYADTEECAREWLDKISVLLWG